MERLLSIKTTADNGNGSEVKKTICCSTLSQYTRNSSRCRSPISWPSRFFTVTGTITSSVRRTIVERVSGACLGFFGFPAGACAWDCPVCGCGVGVCGGGFNLGCAGAAGAVCPGWTGGLVSCWLLSGGGVCCARAGHEKSNTMPKAKRVRVIRVSRFEFSVTKSHTNAECLVLQDPLFVAGDWFFIEPCAPIAREIARNIRRCIRCIVSNALDLREIIQCGLPASSRAF